MTKEITVVTTFHPEGMKVYGQNFLNSFAEKVDKKIKLICYAEDCNPVNPDPNQITILDQVKSLPKLVAFKNKWKDVPKANGKCPWPERRPRDYHKEFKWDAVRFANKVYAVFDAVERSKDWCVWMDADSIIHSDWGYDEFIDCLPDTSWITYVGRGKGVNPGPEGKLVVKNWPECGFYGLNLNDQTCHRFLEEFERMYEDPENGFFTLEEWHDSYIFGAILFDLKLRHPNVLDYSAEIFLQNKAKTGGGGHPLINSKLGRWMDHMKGDRKFAGSSKKKDIMGHRDEPYWQTI
jgi:hypothetical protein